MDLTFFQKAWIWGVTGWLCIVGGGLSAWAVSGLEGYERPAYLIAIVIYGMISMFLGVGLDSALPDDNPRT